MTQGNVDAVWDDDLFGPDQEAYYTFATAPNGEYHLNVRMQYESEGSDHIEVKYDGDVEIARLAPGGWVPMGGPIAVSFGAGDQFGVRTYGTNINVYKNGSLVGTRSFAGWAHASTGGFIGVAQLNANNSSRLDNFGGGNYLPVINTAPTAIIDSPLDNAFFVEGQPVNLTGKPPTRSRPRAR